MAFAPSPQQQALYDWVERGNGSCVLEAVAGAGKTTALLGALQRTHGSVAICAFNKEIVKEIDGKVPATIDRKNLRVGTVHSFGFGALRQAYRQRDVKVDGDKLKKLAQQIFGKVDPDTNEITRSPLEGFAVSAASMAKQIGIGAILPISSREAWLSMVDKFDLADELPEDANSDAQVFLGLRMAGQLLKASHAQTTADCIVDYDDMIYEPVRLGLRVWQNDWVFVDEAQDTNATRRALVRMMLKPRGRLIAVGDTRQAIFGFTGADSDALTLIRSEFNATTLPLTVTYRCPKAVVRVARTWVSHIVAADTAPEGDVRYTTEQDYRPLLKTLTPQDAILCRNTAPLISLAYALLRDGVPCFVEGHKIGEGLVKLASKWKVKKLGALRAKLEEWRDREMAKALAKNKGQRAAEVEDQVASLLAIAANLGDDALVSELEAQVGKLFKEVEPGKRAPALTLSTQHRSKGREWDTVVWWGHDRYNPSPYARQEWQQVQEDNLCYVAATRAKQTLIMVSVPAQNKEA